MGRLGILALILFGLCPPSPALARTVLLIHDAGPRPRAAEREAIAWVQDVLGHYGLEVAVTPAEAYSNELLRRGDAVVYLGLQGGDLLDDDMVAGWRADRRAVCWIGRGMEHYAGSAEGDWGFRLDAAEPQAEPARVSFRGKLHWRRQTPLPRIAVTDPDRCDVLATADAPGESRPYAVRVGSIIYLPEFPTCVQGKAGAELILCNLLHEVLETPHDQRMEALLLLTGVTPATEAPRLTASLRTARASGVAFAIAVKPVSLTRLPPPGESRGREAEGQPLRLSARRDLVSALRGAQRDGASIVAVLPAYRDEATAGREIEAAVEELARCGLYPVAWAVDRRDRSRHDPVALGRLVSTLIESDAKPDRDPCLPALPFLARAGGGGPQIIPLTASPLREGRGEVEQMMEVARQRAALPDPWFTAAVEVGAPPEAVSLLVAGLQDMGYGFTDLRHRRSWTRSETLQIETVDARHHLEELAPEGWGIVALGPEPGARLQVAGADSARRQTKLARPGAIVVAHAAKEPPRIIFSFEGDPEALAQRAVQRLARVVVMFAAAAAATLALIYLGQLVQRRGA